MKVKYIANHVKTDSFPGVGLVWEPGQEREVTSTVAEHLLKYPDTWVKAEDEINQHVNEGLGPVSVEAGKNPEPVGFIEKDKIAEEPLPVVNFHAMDRAALEKYAFDNFKQKFSKKTDDATVRERVTKLHTQHEMEDKTR